MEKLKKNAGQRTITKDGKNKSKNYHWYFINNKCKQIKHSN